MTFEKWVSDIEHSLDSKSNDIFMADACTFIPEIIILMLEYRTALDVVAKGLTDDQLEIVNEALALEPWKDKK